MGFNFRKSIKIAPGIRLNLTQKGISSVSMGTKGARVSAGKRGVQSTLGVPGTGLSYTHKLNSSSKSVKISENTLPTLPLQSFSSQPERKVTLLLGLGIFFMPYIFAWFTLREGYSTFARVICFCLVNYFYIGFEI
ncbi:DUF4236 domain-containing protein [Acinetobacter sp. HR7]|uniref:DUF4236 domain-containing protein n=1 Tax=Acinetobacter sp. HR7 TaxID=1509403 RepID=UPI0009D68E0A